MKLTTKKGIIYLKIENEKEKLYMNLFIHCINNGFNQHVDLCSSGNEKETTAFIKISSTIKNKDLKLPKKNQ